MIIILQIQYEDTWIKTPKAILKMLQLNDNFQAWILKDNLVLECLLSDYHGSVAQVGNKVIIIKQQKGA